MVCDKQPLAAAGPWPASTRLTLQRGKYTYICFRHSELPRTMFTKLAVTDPNTQKLLFACESCPRPSHPCSVQRTHATQGSGWRATHASIRSKRSSLKPWERVIAQHEFYGT